MAKLYRVPYGEAKMGRGEEIHEPVGLWLQNAFKGHRKGYQRSARRHSTVKRNVKPRNKARKVRPQEIRK